MLLTVKLDMSNAKAPALLNYIKTLDFVSIDEKYNLTDEEKRAVDEGLTSLENEEKLKHKDVSLIEQLTDLQKDNNAEIPQWQKDIVLKRIKKSKENPERLLDWDTVKDSFILD